MVDTHPSLVTAIESATGLQCYYELFCDSSTALPCVTWNNTNQKDTAVSDVIQYSETTYDIKLWGKDISTLQTKALLLDPAMKNLGLRLVASNMLRVESQICMIFTYRGLIRDTQILNI